MDKTEGSAYIQDELKSVWIVYTNIFTRELDCVFAKRENAEAYAIAKFGPQEDLPIEEFELSAQ
jgi:hypothetical protein